MRAAAALLPLLLLLPPAQAAEPCLSKAQARSMFPRVHIYWFNDDGRRCWSNRRGRPVAPVARSKPNVRELLPVVPLLLEPSPPWPVFDSRWEWQDALAEPDDGAPIYSTFAPGAEPDVWPVLPPASRSNAAAAVVGVALSGSLLVGAFWFAASQVSKLSHET